MKQVQPAVNNKEIAVYGAAGHTGRFVVRELLRRGIQPIAVGRNPKHLEEAGFQHRGVELRTASTDNAASLDTALSGTALVINCAGPFIDTAEALATAALRQRIHYVDVAAEQASTLNTFECFSAKAREAGVIFIPAMGFYGGLGDLLATAAMGDWARADDIRIGTALDSWQPTAGTRLTGKRNTAQRLVLDNGRLRAQDNQVPESSWRFPEPFGEQPVVEVPLSETILISRHLRVNRLHTYLNLRPLQDLGDATTPPPSAVDDSGRSGQMFLMEAIARKENEVRRATVRGRDIYAFTAPLVVEAALRILAGEVKKPGVWAPGEVFDAGVFLCALTPEHVTFEVTFSA